MPVILHCRVLRVSINWLFILEPQYTHMFPAISVIFCTQSLRDFCFGLLIGSAMVSDHVNYYGKTASPHIILIAVLTNAMDRIPDVK
jgi:hypothetical protein